MIPLSCANCWHNALQYDAVGLTIGYCSLHRCVLNRSEETTCGGQMRKDLPLASAKRENSIHRNDFDPTTIVVLRTRRPANDEISKTEADLKYLRGDDVGDAVADYGQLGAKIESLAQLKRIPGTRAELARLCLGRSYVHNCVQRNGSWTSGIHLFWWTRSRLTDEPELKPADLRYSNTLPLERKVRLAQWSIIMLRLAFLSDIASYAKAESHCLGDCADLLDRAAEAVDTFNPQRVLSWTKRTALRELDRRLAFDEYQTIAIELHREPDL